MSLATPKRAWGVCQRSLAGSFDFLTASLICQLQCVFSRCGVMLGCASSLSPVQLCIASAMCSRTETSQVPLYTSAIGL
eukprot:4421006-Prymnesium_polylepis.1